MDDMIAGSTRKPDRKGLFLLASRQRGYFTTAQAAAYGYARDLLTYHARTGTLLRASHGLYRFRDYPSTPLEEVVAAWLAAGADTTVVSHESALEWWDLSDVIPNAIHLTVPRSRRHLPHFPGVQFHTTTRPFVLGDAREYDAARVTSPLRTILDLAEVGAIDEQLVYALSQARRRGWVTVEELCARAERRGSRAQRAVERLLRYSVV